jgi:arabinose-5-phosphate isomerase
MPKALSTERRTSARSGDLIASAVRTLEVEATGITILSAAINDVLGRAVISAEEMISGAQVLLIVTGMVK